MQLSSVMLAIAISYIIGLFQLPPGRGRGVDIFKVGSGKWGDQRDSRVWVSLWADRGLGRLLRILAILIPLADPKTPTAASVLRRWRW